MEIRDEARGMLPPNSMEANTPTFGRQMVKITRAMASHPRSPKASLDQTPQA